MSTPRLLTVRSVAEQLSVSTRTVHRWVANGTLPATRVGPNRLIRIDPRDLKKIIKPR